MEYINDYNLQMAMAEYEDLRLNRLAWTPNGTKIGTITQVFDNENGNGEQVYAVVKDPNLPKDQVLEVTVLFRGSTGPNEVLSKPADVWNDWVENDLFLGLRVFI
ncbi:TPA: hypothetical protein ACGOYY_001232 [Streptococcus suis]